LQDDDGDNRHRAAGGKTMAADNAFNVIETTIADIQAAYRSGALSARQLIEAYLGRIEAYDKSGPKINSIINLNPRALAEADRLDAALKISGFVGPLHGIPIVIKDQADVAEMPTTLGSVLFKDYRPGSDCFVAAKLRQAGAILLAKATLGELGAGDAHGSLYGSTRNPYDLARTVGGSSGGSGAAVSANFATIGIGQEGLASIRRPAIWNGIAGMRPSIGLVSRGGVYGGWPSMNGSLGPMARTVTDLAKLLDVMAGYDPDDPATAHGVGRAPKSFAEHLDADALKGARLGILREPMGLGSEPQSEDFAKVAAVFDRAVGELRQVGAEIVDPITIPDLKALLAQRSFSTAEGDEGFKLYFAGHANAPFASRQEAMASPLFAQLLPPTRDRWLRAAPEEKQLASSKARIRLMTNMLKVMADHRLDAIVHNAVEHQPTLIKDGVNPPYVDQKGAPHINTFLESVPSVVVPAGFTSDQLPAGITFLGRPYTDADMIRFAYAHEQATHHRRAPAMVA
jgi:Asp-tRNA(Asn)/Glu-tRNA(Gln) amidotransferase A subunit family amidase